MEDINENQRTSLSPVSEIGKRKKFNIRLEWTLPLFAGLLWIFLKPPVLTGKYTNQSCWVRLPFSYPGKAQGKREAAPSLKWLRAYLRTGHKVQVVQGSEDSAAAQGALRSCTVFGPIQGLRMQELAPSPCLASKCSWSHLHLKRRQSLHWVVGWCVRVCWQKTPDTSSSVTSPLPRAEPCPHPLPINAKRKSRHPVRTS